MKQPVHTHTFICTKQLSDSFPYSWLDDFAAEFIASTPTQTAVRSVSTTWELK